jgi:hypothetical protein
LDRLFFVSHPIGSGDVCEWCLVCVVLEATMSLYSSCLVDGRYLVDFYLSHPNDYHYNAVNNRFWIQYHSQDNIFGPTSLAHTHFIWPSHTSEAYTIQHNLLPFQKYLNLTHTITFIHGAFDFATIHGRKSRDKIPQSAWDILKSHSDMFHNPIPHFDVPTVSIHVDHGACTLCFCATQSHDLIQSGTRAQ